MMRGVRQIVTFNARQYLAAAATIATALLALHSGIAHGLVRAALQIAVGLAIFWTISSLVVSWLVYDHSPLTRWTWVPNALRTAPESWIAVHTGVDEASAALRALLPGSISRVFDIFDPVEMTEPSIRRARDVVHTDVPAERADYRALPVPAETIDAAVVLLAAHELRSETNRGTLFAEIRRLLVPGGTVLVAEHLRDWANFLAFGPGFLHFHSRGSWRRCFEAARLAIESEFSITPFVHVFVLRRIS